MNIMRKGVVHGPTIAAIILIITGVLFVIIDPKDNKLEKIKIETQKKPTKKEIKKEISDIENKIINKLENKGEVNETK